MYKLTLYLLTYLLTYISCLLECVAVPSLVVVVGLW